MATETLCDFFSGASSFRFASAYRDGSHYFVLLILTDGVITDMPQTLQSIVSVSWSFTFGLESQRHL